MSGNRQPTLKYLKETTFLEKFRTKSSSACLSCEIYYVRIYLELHLYPVYLSGSMSKYRTRAIITRSWLKTALEY